MLGVAAAAAVGSLIRAVATDYDADFNRRMYGTVAVNIVGSFRYISQIECITREGKTSDAILYGAGSLAAGIAAAYIGWRLGGHP